MIHNMYKLLVHCSFVYKFLVSQAVKYVQAVDLISVDLVKVNIYYKTLSGQKYLFLN